MTASGAVRAPHTTLPGTGALHHALEEARDLARLNDFCSAHVCTVDEVSKDGKRLDPLMVFALMRTHGYVVSEPIRPQQQPRKGHTTWLVDITLLGRASVQLAFCTPDTS